MLKRNEKENNLGIWMLSLDSSTFGWVGESERGDVMDKDFDNKFSVKMLKRLVSTSLQFYDVMKS